jgi:hypothetical protein
MQPPCGPCKHVTDTGRFSNGPVWVDDIANSSVAGSWQVLNYAVGGARACDYRPIPGATPTPAIGPGKISPPLNSVQILNLTQQVGGEVRVGAGRVLRGWAGGVEVLQMLRQHKAP